MSTDFDRKKLSEEVPFSSSPFWGFLDQYYEKHGPAAWDGKIPSYVTNNPALAHAYADLLLGYYLDCQQKGDVQDKPLYVIELGAGSGLFSYYLLKALAVCSASAGLAPSVFRVVITDKVERNLAAIENNPEFQSFFKKGMLSTVLFDCLSDEAMTCRQTQKQLLPTDFAITPVVVAHYLLDSMPMDVFVAKKSKPYPVHISLSRDNVSEYKKNDIRSLNLDQHIMKGSSSYYQNSTLDKLLLESAKQVGDGYFSFPVSAFKAFDKLKSVTGGQFIFSCLDKGFFDWICYKGASCPAPFYHDNAFSFDVNFAALNSWCQLDSSAALFMNTNRTVLKWVIYEVGVELPTQGQMACRYNSMILSQTPLDYAMLYQSAQSCGFEWPLPALLSLLSMSRWDPVLLAQMSKPLLKGVERGGYDDQKYLLAGLKQAESHWVQLPGSADLPLVTGKLMHALGFHEEAIEAFKSSIKCFGEQYSNLFELGRAYFSSGDSSSAATAFARAQKHQVTRQVTEWVKYFKKDRMKINQKKKAIKKGKKGKSKEKVEE